MLVSSVLWIFCRCTCEECATVKLSGALEHRFCRKIAQVRQKLTFDGSIERIKCIKNHDDFAAMTSSVKSRLNKISRVYIYSTHGDSSFYSELVST